jgi:hypothetical protein
MSDENKRDELAGLLENILDELTGIPNLLEKLKKYDEECEDLANSITSLEFEDE